MKHYEFTDETIEHRGHILHRIRATRDIYVGGRLVARQGELGGWVETEKNISLSAGATPWVAGAAKVYEKAMLMGDVLVQNEAQVFGHAYVCDSAVVAGGAVVKGHATVKDNAFVGGDAVVSGHSFVSDSAQVFDRARVSVSAGVAGGAVVKGHALVTETAVVNGQAVVEDHASVRQNASVGGTSVLSGKATVTGGALVLNGVFSGHAVLRGGDSAVFTCSASCAEGELSLGCQLEVVGVDTVVVEGHPVGVVLTLNKATGRYCAVTTPGSYWSTSPLPVSPDGKLLDSASELREFDLEDLTAQSPFFFKRVLSGRQDG